MKYGHVEVHLTPASSRRWTEGTVDELAQSPDIVFIVSGGVVVAICGVVALWLRMRRRERGDLVGRSPTVPPEDDS